MQFYLSILALLLFAREYLYLAIEIVFLTLPRNTASLALANFEIWSTETLKEMMGGVKDYRQHYGLLLPIST